MNNETNIDVQYVSPLKKILMTIGELPTSYLETMSYYEMLVWFTEFLKNQVIPTVNNNAEAVQELQTLYEELREYVNNYFENLDVQNEINNKLDSLVEDGTLYNIINNELFTDINNQIVQNAENIGTLNQEMDNTIKLTDNNVITNNMLSQEVREALTGGSTAVVGVNSISEENLQDKSVTVFKLDNTLQQNYNLEYVDSDDDNVYSGYAHNNSGTLQIITTTNDYKYKIIDLDNLSDYLYSGFNSFSVCGILIVDGTDVIASSTLVNTSNRLDYATLHFRTNKTGLKAYLNFWNTINTNVPAEMQLLPTLAKINKISNYNKNNELSLIKTIDNYYGDRKTNTSILTDVPRLGAYENMFIDIYKLSKGVKYQVSGYNLWDISGIIITNEKLQISYKSNTSESSVSTLTPISYEFTATDNGFILLSYGRMSTNNLSYNIDIVNSTNKFNNKNWSLIGDSLTDINANPSVKKYYSYIQDEIGINIQNLGQSGCGYARKYNNGNNFMEQSLLVNSNADVVTIFGSFNDLSSGKDLGTASDTTSDTILGCVYITLINLINNRPNTKIGVILPTPWEGRNPRTKNSAGENYVNGIKEVANSLSIPVLDLYHESNLFPWITTFKNNYFVNGDGVHPNTMGNKKFYSQIEEFIKSLM